MSAAPIAWTTYASLSVAGASFSATWVLLPLWRRTSKLRRDLDAHREVCPHVVTPDRDPETGRFVKHHDRPATVQPASPTPADTHLAGLVQHQHDGGS